MPTSTSRLPRAFVAGLIASGSIIPAGATEYKVLHSFGKGKDGALPVAPLLYVNGVFYGTTDSGGVDNGSGVVFQITPAGMETVLYHFKTGDGVGSQGGLTYFKGDLYGTNYLGGNTHVSCLYGLTGCGAIFKVTTDGVYTDLHAFNGTDGAKPEAGLTRLGNDLYGTTSSGGNSDDGTVFKIKADGTFEKIVDFGSNANDGQMPAADLVSVNQVLYGTTTTGGTKGDGTIFSISPNGSYETFYSFGGVDGVDSQGGLIAVDGTFYGTTLNAGKNGKGNVYAITAAGVETMLYSFKGGADGSAPYGKLTYLHGALYGTTPEGGTYGKGTIFKLSLAGKEKVLHSFGKGIDGATPQAGLINVAGVLYGTTASGGKYYATSKYFGGTVFSIKP